MIKFLQHYGVHAVFAAVQIALMMCWFSVARSSDHYGLIPLLVCWVYGVEWLRRAFVRGAHSSFVGPIALLVAPLIAVGFKTVMESTFPDASSWSTIASYAFLAVVYGVGAWAVLGPALSAHVAQVMNELRASISRHPKLCASIAFGIGICAGVVAIPGVELPRDPWGALSTTRSDPLGATVAAVSIAMALTVPFGAALLPRRERDVPPATAAAFIAAAVLGCACYALFVLWLWPFLAASPHLPRGVIAVGYFVAASLLCSEMWRRSCMRIRSKVVAGVEGG